MKPILLLPLFLLFACGSKPQFDYYYSADKTEILTIMKSEGKVYFISGYYNQINPPKSYITIVSGMDNAYSCYLEWHEKICIINTMFGDWIVVGHSQNITLNKINDNLFYNRVTCDTTGKYIAITGDIFP